MSKKIVVSGYYGFNNAGDEAILLAVLNGLRKKIPDADITVFSGNPQLTRERHDVKSVHRFNLFGILKTLFKSDLLLSGGGSLLQDVTSIKSLLYYLTILFLGSVLSKKVMLYAQGIGPIDRKWLRNLTAFVLKRVDVLAVRDEESQKFLLSLGVKDEKIKLTADAVFTLPKIELKDGEVLLNRYGVKKNQEIVGVAIRSWNNDKFLGALVDALDILADAGKQIFLIPLQYAADITIAKKLQKAMRHDAKILDGEHSAEELLSLTGNLNLLIGMRLHSLIFAAVMGVPFVALDYDPKVTGFVKMVQGVTVGTVDAINSEKLVDACKKVCQKNLDLEKLQCEAEKNNEIVGQLLERSLVNC